MDNFRSNNEEDFNTDDGRGGNDGADSWFLEYKDQISDMITYMDFSVE